MTIFIIQNTTNKNDEDINHHIRAKFLCAKRYGLAMLDTTSSHKKWWFSQIRAFESHVGFQTRFTVNYEGDKYVHLWVVLESIPQEKLVLDWRYANHPGKAYAQFELQSTPSGTLLTFTSDVLEFFPNHKVFSRASILNGWKTLLQERLPEYVEKNN